jgi:hypothetical protein
MLDDITDIARGVHTCRRNGQVMPLRSMLEELSAIYSPQRVQELLDKQSGSADQGADTRRAMRLLHKARVASLRGNSTRSFAMVKLALEAVGRDKQVLRDLMVTHKLAFTIFPRSSKNVPAPRQFAFAPSGWSNSRSR